MLKLIIVLLAINFANCRPSYEYASRQQDGLMNVTELIRSNGYPVENYTIETKDGYLLDLIRIPHGISGRHQSMGPSPSKRQNQDDSSSSSSSGSDSGSSSSSSEESGRPPVLLVHGLLSSSEDFVLGGPSQSLAYVLADNGYDVYLGNVRGSIYGRKHSVLNPETDPAFWKFCWDDIGRKDLPAMINKALEISGSSKLYYVGHMQGTTFFYVMASEMPEYNKKVHAMISLGPVAFLSNTENKMLRLISEKQNAKGWIVKNLGENEFKPSRELIGQGGEQDCYSKGNNEKICENVFFLLNGYNSQHLNTTSIMSVVRRVPSGGSTKEILHFGELVKTGRFAMFSDKGGRDYDLSNVRVPIGIFYTPMDYMSSMSDVDKLSKKLPNVKQIIRVEQLTNNMDMLYGKDVSDIIYRPMMKVMRNIDNNSKNNVD